MKKLIACFALLVAVIVASADSLTPDTVTVTWVRSDVTAYADTNNVYMAGVTYRMTNCQALAWSTNTPQDLTGLLTTIRVGDAGTNLQFSCSPQVATSGTFSCDFHFPTWTPSAARGVTGQEGIELTVASTNPVVSVTYKSRKLFMVTQPLH
jgi:hypothetical protein